MKRRMPFFGSLLRIHSINPNDQRIEYMFRVTLLTMTISALLFTIVSVMGLILGFVPVDTPGILITMDILFLIGWLLSRARRWRLARFIPLGIIYLIALYGNFIGGIEAPAMLLYVLAMTFASTLFGRGILSGVTVLCLLSYLTISLLQYFGIITPLRTAESVFLNRIMVAFFSMLGVGILLGFLLTLIEKALALSRERETELEIRDTKYTTLFNALADGVLILDSTGRIEEVNRAASIQTGFRRSEMVEMGFIGLSCCAEADLRKIDEVIRNRSAVRFETSLKRKGGELFPVEAAVTASDIGENVKAICVIRDITERKAVEKDKERVQQQLIQAQKMEAVGTLASGIAHDFNNMLGGITGSLSLMEILLDKEGTPRDNRLFSHLETALKSSERAAGITRQLLMLSRKSEQKYLPTDLSIPLRNVITLCRNSFPKTIDFDVHIDTEPMRVLADPIQIEQVVLNLCVNASHAMTIMRNAEERQGGTLSLTTGRVSVDEAFIRDHPSASPGQHYYDIAVSDTGVGMDEETKRRIFDPFFTLKGKNEGTGLGLSMAYSIVGQHGGFIDVYSFPGRGSAVHVFLPALNDNSLSGTGEPTVAKIVKGTQCILVIDDELSILKVAKAMLEEFGYRVITAENGRDGLARLAESTEGIDAVLLDLSMPGISGLEVLREMREAGSSVPVLLTSGLLDEEDMGKAREMGAVGMLGKPYTATELSSGIATILKNARHYG